VWAVLGIPPTRDRTAVRKAYAEKLKQTNPEDDPEGFQELRQAYEQVLGQLSRTAQVEAVEEARPPEASETVEDSPRPIGPGDASPAAPDPVALHWQACRNLHQWIVEQHPSEAEQDRALASLLSSPAMENLNVRAETERGLASLILGLAPHADGLIIPCIAFFGWEAGAHQFGGIPEARAVVQRVQTLRIVAELGRRSHAHHKAFEVLKRPAPTGGVAMLWAMARHRTEVRDLFRYAYRQAPGLFNELPRESVEFWSRHGGNSKPFFKRRRFGLLRNWGVVVFMVYVLVRLAIFAGGAATLGSASGPLAPPSSMQMRTDTLAVIDGRALYELKDGSLTKARQDYEFALSRYPDDTEALFGRGLIRTKTGDDAGNADKLAAIQRDPWVRNKFVAREIPARDLIVYDTAANLVAQPKRRWKPPRGVTIDKPLTVQIRCLVSLEGGLHDCGPAAPVTSDQEPLAAAVVKVMPSAKASPAMFKGAPVADAPILLSMTIQPMKTRP
jgi:hypothetical protein